MIKALFINIFMCLSFRKTRLMIFFFFFFTCLTGLSVCVCVFAGGWFSFCHRNTHIRISKPGEEFSSEQENNAVTLCWKFFFSLSLSLQLFWTRSPPPSRSPSLSLQLIKLGLRSCWCRWVNIALTRCQFSLSLHSYLFRPLCRYTHTLTSSVSVLLVCVCVCGH